MNSTLTIRLEGELMRHLEAEARRTRTSKGELVRRALRERLQKRKPSVLDALGALVGSVEGPAGLSSNRRHLAGFGRTKRT
jgi:hypothetical protein